MKPKRSKSRESAAISDLPINPSSGKREERKSTNADEPAAVGNPPTNRSSLTKRVAFRIAAVILGLMVAVGIFEIFLRLFQIKPLRYEPPKIMAWNGSAFEENDNTGGVRIKIPGGFVQAGVVMGEYVPGAAFKLVFPDNPRGYFDRSNGVLMTINSLGLRGEEITRDKPAGTYRILGIGDSFAFGEGVKNEDTFLCRLQARLNADAFRKHPAYQVLNAGVQGYNTRDEVIYLEHRWLELNPDLILIIFYLNDAYSDNTILNRGQELGIYDGQPGGLARYSYLWDIVQHRYATRHTAKAVEEFYQRQYFSDADNFLKNPREFKVDWPVCVTALERANQLAKDRKVKLGLVMFPELYKLNSGYPFGKIHKLVGDTCRRMNIPYLDLFDTFRGRDARTLWVHPSNHHPNEIAHQIAEIAIEEFVREKFLDARTNAAAAGSP